jgi:hypothetical protein
MFSPSKTAKCNAMKISKVSQEKHLSQGTEAGCGDPRDRVELQYL